jgi:hypothetical protein
MGLFKRKTKETSGEAEGRKRHIRMARKRVFLHISMEIYNNSSKSSSSTLKYSAYGVK